MLTFLNPITEDKQPAVAGEDLAQGIWCTEAGLDTTTGLPSMEKVDSDAIAKYNRHLLYVVAKYPIDIEYADTSYETIDDGDHLIRIGNKSGLLIEDSYLSTNSTTADWENASFGDLLVLNTSGFLTITGAGDAGSGRTTVAKFIRYVNGIVWYETV
jgi:hypothetical protein